MAPLPRPTGWRDRFGVQSRLPVRTRAVGRLFRLAVGLGDMSAFTVRGRYQSRDGWAPFESVVEAPNDAVARERAYANLGSRHGLKRRQIELEEVETA